MLTLEIAPHGESIRLIDQDGTYKGMLIRSPDDPGPAEQLAASIVSAGALLDVARDCLDVQRITDDGKFNLAFAALCERARAALDGVKGLPVAPVRPAFGCMDGAQALAATVVKLLSPAPETVPVNSYQAFSLAGYEWQIVSQHATRYAARKAAREGEKTHDTGVVGENRWLVLRRIPN